MELLRSIVPILDELSNEYIDITIQKFNNKELKAIKIILANQTRSTKHLKSKLARDLYNEAYTSPTFRSFITSFEDKIIKIASLIESKGSDIQKKRFMIHQSYTAMYHMIITGLRIPAITLGEKVLKSAIRYHDYTTAEQVCKLLVCHHGTFGDKNSLQSYIEKYDKITSIIKLEFECEMKHSKLLHEIRRNNISSNTRINTEKWLKSVKHKFNIESADFHYYYFNIKLKLCKENDFEKICLEAIAYFESLYFNHSAFISIFKNHLLKHRFKKRDVSINTIQTLISLRNNVEKFGTPWYRYTQSLAKLYLNRGDINDAWKWISIVKRSKKYRNLPKSHKNEWELLCMYKQLVAGEYDEVNIRKIKYNLNYTATTKSSTNIPFLIGELVYLLKTGEQDLDRKINHLRNTIKHQCKGNELDRGLGFCDAVQKGQKFVAKKAESSFENEYVFYEKLLEKV